MKRPSPIRIKTHSVNAWISFVIALTIGILLTLPIDSSGQVRSKQVRRSWLSNDPFNTGVFVENMGQFDAWGVTGAKVKYAIARSETIFFTQTGLIIKLSRSSAEGATSAKDKGDLSKDKDLERPKRLPPCYITLNWEGCDPDAMMLAEEETANYYTFGEKGYGHVRAKGYKKLTYKNLYPNTDVIFTIPEGKQGIKYAIVLHAGADPAAVRMRYSGDVGALTLDRDGNLLIKTAGGNISDHAPTATSGADGVNVPVRYIVKGNGVTFGISQNQSPQKGDLIIDPWLIVPSSLSSDNAGYDLEVDDYGNVYVAGGTVNAPYKLAKYDASGNLLWTFTNPVDWNPDTYCYSKFCLLPKTGTTFMGEGFNSLGPRIMKIGSDGALETTSANFGPNNEIWLMFYNRCQGQLVAFGGGTSNMTNVLVISDTNLQSSTPHNFNGSAFDCCNDIAAAQMDYNGDFYALMPKSTGDYSFPLTCRLQKCLTSSNYDPPLAFNSDAECDFLECSNPGIPGFGDCADGATVRANALALNLGNVFTYDGKTLKAWNKSNGSQISSIIVNSGYAEGMYRQHEGIAVDECGNVYVAGNNCVHVLQFNGSSFNTIQTINSLPGQVYDITIDQASGMLYVSGLGFVTCIQVTSCGNNQLTLTHSEDCGNSATITASGGTPPYSYIWSNGSTEQTVTGTSGVYYVTVTDNSCITLKGTDSVSICSIFIPNVFTPDGDGHNDQFVILYDGWEIYHLLIYNRWGKLMFESNDKNTHWNGKAPNKEDAAVGVYYYVLNIGTKSYSGTVTLLR